MKQFLDRLTAFYNDPEHRNRRFFITTVLGFVVGGLLSYLLVDIVSKREQARHAFFRVVEITDDTNDPAIWGKNFPMQYEDYLKTADIVARVTAVARPCRIRRPKPIRDRLSLSRSFRKTPDWLQCGRATPSRKTFVKSAGMPTCLKTRSTPSARRSVSLAPV